MATLTARPRLALPRLARRGAEQTARIAHVQPTPLTDDAIRRRSMLRLQAEDHARRATSVAPPTR